MQTVPIVLTLILDEVAQAYFNTLRNQYFPAELNLIDAHLTLFHHLPPNENLITETLYQITNRSPIILEVTSVKSIGNGTAFIISSPPLQAMHKAMQQAFTSFLIPQDKQKLWPHITIQNKVGALKARQTTDFLNQDFKPFTVQGIGIASWFYLNGPWQAKEKFLFAV